MCVGMRVGGLVLALARVPVCVGTRVGARTVVQVRVQVRVYVGMCVGLRCSWVCVGLHVGALERTRTGNRKRRTRSPRVGSPRFRGRFGTLSKFGGIFGLARIGGFFGGFGRRGFPRGEAEGKNRGILATGVSTFHRNSKNTPDYSTGKKASEPRDRWVSRLRPGGNRPIPTRYPVSPFPLVPPIPFRSTLPRGTAGRPNRRFEPPEFDRIPLRFHVSTVSTNGFVPLPQPS